MISTLTRLLFAAMLCALVVGGTVRTTDATSVSEYCAAPIDQEFLTLINNYRAQNGAGPVAMSQTLGAAAQHHALDMARTGTLAHTLSDGTDWLQNIINHGYPHSYRSENIAWGYGSAQAVFDAWKASSTHNTTMLNGGFGAIGISRVYDASAPYRYYWVTTFGSQLDTAAKSCSGSAEPTATSIPATATATKAPPTATPTKVPATATPITVQPTATATSVPATAVPTNVPPTATNTAVPPTEAPLVGVPVAPTRVRMSAKPRFVQVSWRDNATNETGYRVYRSTDGGASWQVIADRLPANTSQYKDDSPVGARGSATTYAVVAYNASGESAVATVDSAAVRTVANSKPGQ